MNRLKKLRKQKGYTQAEMQHLTGVNRSLISKLENGKCNYTVSQCMKIAVALDTSMDYLLGRTNEKRPYPRSSQ